MNRVLVSSLMLTVGVLAGGCSNQPPTPTASVETPSAKPSIQQVPTETTQRATTPPSEPAKPDEPAAPSATPTTEGAPSSSPQSAQPPAVQVVDDGDLQSVAVAYITVRENRWAWMHTTPDTWLADAARYTTPAGQARLAQQYPVDAAGSLGSAWDLAKEQGIAVAPKVGECLVMDAGGIDSADQKIVTCSVTDLLVTKDGAPIPISQTPSGWPFVGAQQDAVLQMVNDGTAWKVDWDMTGMAS